MFVYIEENSPSGSLCKEEGIALQTYRVKL